MKALRQISTFAFDSYDAAEEYIKKEKKEKRDLLTKHTIDYKTKKSKGEIISEAWVVQIQLDFGKVFDDTSLQIDYE